LDFPSSGYNKQVTAEGSNNAFFSEIHRLFLRAIPHEISSRMIATTRKRITVSLGYGIPTHGDGNKRKIKNKQGVCF